MSQRITGTGKRKNGRTMTYLWIAILAVITIGLIYYEQTALLYILATLGVTALLVVVAMADLSGSRRASLTEGLISDDAAAIGNGITSTTAPRKATRK
jgi:hypothetical protein